MTTAIYGGSFNPPHAGHVSVACTVARELKPDRFLIIPDYAAPHKLMAAGSPEPAQRLEMCRLAFGDISGAEVSDIEISRGGRSYTADTIAALRQFYPNDRFFLVVGSDMLLSFTKVWYRYDYILSECTLVVLSRSEGDIPELEKAASQLRDGNTGAEVILLRNHDVLEVSSTEVREMLALEKSAELCGKGLLTRPVCNYIVENGLYSDNR